ncbi:MAG: glycosyltransferase family 39 protein [Terracidiphilus sp.]
MNGTATSETIHAPTQQVSASWRGYIIFTLCAGLYLLPFMRVVFVTRDEGTFLTGAVRIVHGQVFARDFFEVMGPGTFYWLAAFFKLFGVNFLAARICLFVSSLGTGLSIYFLSRAVCPQYRPLPCLILAGTSFGALWPGISHHVDSNFFALLSVVCMVIWNTKPRNSLLIAAGVLAGVTTCIFQPKGVLMFCALVAWLCIQRRRTRGPWIVLALLTGGYFAIIGLVLAYFWSQGALGSLYYANFTFPHQHYGTVNAVSYAYGIGQYYWTTWVTAFGGAIWSVAIAAILITPLLFIASLPLLMLLVGIRYKWNSVTPEIALYWLCGWAVWLSEFHRCDIWHLVFGSPLLIVLFIHALTESRRKLANVAVQILAISAVCLAGLNCCVVLAAGTHSSATRMGNVVAVGAGSDQVLRFLNENTSPGDEILSYPYCPTYYFLSATTNPTRYSILMYNYNTPSQFQEVVDILERKRVRYIIWEAAFAAHAADGFPGAQPRSPNDLIMEPYLESHYKLVEDDHGIRIMERK